MTPVVRLSILLLTALFLVTTPSAPADAHVLHLKGGKTVEGEILEQTDEQVVIRTTFNGVRTVPRAEIKKINDTTPPLRSQLAYRLDQAKKAAADPAAGAASYWKTHGWAKKAGFKEELKSILEQIIVLTPQDARARKKLGHSKVDGTWMSPEEERAHKDKQEEAENIAKGLVKHEGKWVTPEEKEAIEKGLIKDGDEWVTKEEWHERRGEVLVDGKWIRLGEAEGKAWVLQVVTDNRLKLTYHWGPHFDCAAEVAPPLTKRVLTACEASWREAWRILAPTPEDYGSGIGERIQLALFKKSPSYARFAGWFNKQADIESITPGWGRSIKRQPSFYWPHPERVIGSYVFPNTDKTFVSIVNHNVGLIMLTRYRFNVRFPSEWLQEGFSYYLEMTTAKYSLSFSLGSGASTAGGGEEGPIWADSDKWKKGLSQLVAKGQDPPMKRLARMGFDAIGYPELVKSWSVVDFLIKWDKQRFKKFVDLSKVRDNQGEVANEEEALREAYGVGYRQLDKKWRAYVQAGFKVSK